MKSGIILVGLATIMLFLLALVLPVMASDYTLEIFGNANGDDTINMQDVTYTELIILEYQDQTELADAKYDGEIDILDVTQIELIILGKDKEITLIDTKDQIVTLKKPIERLVALYTGNLETLRSLKSKDIIVGIGTYSDQWFLSEFKGLPTFGSLTNPDVEAILELNPDAIILHTGAMGSGPTLDLAQDVLESAGITVLRFNLNQPEIYLEEVEKLGYALGKKEEAQVLIDFYTGIYNQIEDIVATIPDENRPTVYFESSQPYTTTNTMAYIDESGGCNILPDISGVVDQEEVISNNPEIIFKAYSGVAGTGGFTLAGGYELDADDTSGLEEIREEIMNRPELENIKAVKDGNVYIITSHMLGFMPGSGCRHFLQRAYQVKWLHPDLFKDLDPKALHQQYLTEFQELEIDLDEKGVFVYPLVK